jgi:hypothetical protein
VDHEAIRLGDAASAFTPHHDRLAARHHALRFALAGGAIAQVSSRTRHWCELAAGFLQRSADLHEGDAAPDLREQ